MDKRMNPITNNIHRDVSVNTWNRQSRPSDRPLAMANIPMQLKITKVYNPIDALRSGTLFPELDKPFSGSRGVY